MRWAAVFVLSSLLQRRNTASQFSQLTEPTQILGADKYPAFSLHPPRERTASSSGGPHVVIQKPSPEDVLAAWGPSRSPFPRQPLEHGLQNVSCTFSRGFKTSRINRSRNREANRSILCKLE